MENEKYLNSLITALNDKGKNQSYIDICLGYANILLSNHLPVIFDNKHLSMLIGIKGSDLMKLIFCPDRFYSKCEIPKKSGGTRVLCMPALQLKYIQRWILDKILNNIRISDYATGFCLEKSIVTNANRHVGKDCIINMDIKDFFPTINFKTIFRIFSYYGYTKEVSFSLAKLCTYEDCLPQGSPASPCLSNIACLKLDKRLSELSKKYEADYTRYADDITISGKYGIQNIIPIINGILTDQGFTTNDKKTRTAYRYQRQEVTGIIVNDNRVRVNKKYKREIYQEIYYCMKYGVANHLNKINCQKAFYKEHLYGKALFINMVEKDEGKKLFDLLEKINWDY